MYRKTRFLSILFSLIAVIFITVLASCASTSSNKLGDVDNVTGQYEPSVAAAQEGEADVQEKGTAEETGAVRLPSASKPKSYFSKIPQDILANVELGSPQSLTAAMTDLHKTGADFTDNEKVLIYIASEMMRILWPSQKVTWTVFDVTDETPYTGALKSVRNGIYDTSTGNTDFLSTFLPSLVYLMPNITSGVRASCEEGILNALKLNPSSVAANYLAGVFYESNGNYKTAQPYLAKAYEQSQVLELALEYAKVLSKNGNSVLAEKVMNDTGLNAGSNLAILKQSAWIAFEKGDYAVAEEYVARVLQQTPNDLEFVLFRARIFIEKNDYIHAVSLLDMYARQNDSNLDYLILRARVQLDWSKNTNAATETVEKAMQLYPDSLDALLIAARISSATDSPVAGKYADELAAIVLEKNPSNKEALIYAMDGLIQRENWAEAYAISSRLMESQSDNEEVVFKHVTVCLKMDKYFQAMEVAQKAYSANPSSELITQTYVLACTHVLSREEAVKLIDSMMSSASSKMKSYLYYRKSYLERSEDTALADLRSSLIANPRNSDALFRLYEIYYDKKDYRKAQYYLKQVVAINPNDSSVRKLNEALTQLVQ
ncbi:MAG: tetratricopeptide repeat protein [Treponema sp.]|nr:tetratricopeptide repeat protein [Treponema sp.]